MDVCAGVQGNALGHCAATCVVVIWLLSKRTEQCAACAQLVDEFVRAIFGRFPHTVLQFEVRVDVPLLINYPFTLTPPQRI